MSSFGLGTDEEISGADLDTLIQCNMSLCREWKESGYEDQDVPAYTSGVNRCIGHLMSTFASKKEEMRQSIIGI